MAEPGKYWMRPDPTSIPDHQIECQFEYAGRPLHRRLRRAGPQLTLIEKANSNGCLAMRQERASLARHNLADSRGFEAMGLDRGLKAPPFRKGDLRRHES